MLFVSCLICTVMMVGGLLVDEQYAFNLVNGGVVLWNARLLWPWCSCFLFNSYQRYASLFIQGLINFSK